MLFSLIQELVDLGYGLQTIHISGLYKLTDNYHHIGDKIELRNLAVVLMRHPSINRDWISIQLDHMIAKLTAPAGRGFYGEILD